MARIVPFVLQEHYAKRAGHHYDLRIKYLNKNKLASWALTKARIPEKPGEKYLAVRTSDHDMDWLKFEGKIEDRQGKGTVKILQRGQVEILAWSSRVISFRIDQGSPLQGKYALVLIKRGKKQTDWLLIKGRDN